MKKIILAATAAFAMFAMSGMANARVHSGKHSHYSANSQVEEQDPLSSVFGGEDWSVSPQPRFKNKKQAKQYQDTQEENWGFGAASTSLVAYGHQLQRQGFRVSEHPSFGGVHRVHHGWAHYAGRAIDVNVGRGVVEARSGYAHSFDQLAADARAAGYTVLWRVPGHYNHIHIQH
jgi:hypothetical protein